MSTAVDVFSQALQLPESQRADLAYQLLQSLPIESPDTDADSSTAEDVVLARQQSVRRGDCPLEDWTETMAHVDRALSEERGGP